MDTYMMGGLASAVLFAAAFGFTYWLGSWFSAGLAVALAATFMRLLGGASLPITFWVSVIIAIGAAFIVLARKRSSPPRLPEPDTH